MIQGEVTFCSGHDTSRGTFVRILIILFRRFLEITDAGNRSTGYGFPVGSLPILSISSRSLVFQRQLINRLDMPTRSGKWIRNWGGDGWMHCHSKDTQFNFTVKQVTLVDYSMNPGQYWRFINLLPVTTGRTASAITLIIFAISTWQKSMKLSNRCNYMREPPVNN